jgi:hypothetical protein
MQAVNEYKDLPPLVMLARYVISNRSRGNTIYLANGTSHGAYKIVNSEKEACYFCLTIEELEVLASATLGHFSRITYSWICENEAQTVDYESLKEDVLDSCRRKRNNPCYFTGDHTLIR